MTRPCCVTAPGLLRALKAGALGEDEVAGARYAVGATLLRRLGELKWQLPQVVSFACQLEVVCLGSAYLCRTATLLAGKLDDLRKVWQRLPGRGLNLRNCCTLNLPGGT